MNSNVINNSIIITMDMDWAPETLINYSLELLNERNIPATLFLTNKINMITNNYETGIHPNFDTLDYKQKLTSIHDDFPDAKGMRAHSLFFSERLIKICESLKLQYLSNTIMYMQDNIKPYLISKKLVELPMFWMDNFYLRMENNGCLLKCFDLGLENKGLKIFNFHPIHIFMNTSSLGDYNNYKEFYHQPEKLKKYENTTKRGIRDIFLELLDNIIDKGLRTDTLINVSNNFWNKLPK